MAKGMDKMIAEMRKQAEELTIAVRVFDRMSNGNGRAMNNVRTALGMAKRGKGNVAAPVEGEPVHIEGLRDVPLSEAAKMALRALKRPAKPAEIRQLLIAGGRESVPEMSQTLNNLIQRPHLHHVKRTKKGYVITA